MQEEWREIVKCPNYMISNLGRIKSLNYHRTGKEQILKQNINGRGYNYVNISIQNKYKNILIHREVAKAFLNNNDINKTDINHIDGNKQNNCVNNLEWCTRSENIQHAYNIGLKKGGKGMTYKKRCQLAIEYIHNHQPVFELSSKEQIQKWFEKEYYVQLLNILQGDDK